MGCCFFMESLAGSDGAEFRAAHGTMVRFAFLADTGPFIAFAGVLGVNGE